MQPLMLCCPTGGQWEEPWDQQSALDTIRKIERHWYQLKSEPNASDPPVDAAEQMEGDSSDDEEPPRKQLKPSVNKVCPHVACSAQPVCLVEQLQTVRSHYRGRVDQFRIKVREPHCLLQPNTIFSFISIDDSWATAIAIRHSKPFTWPFTFHFTIYEYKLIEFDFTCQVWTGTVWCVNSVVQCVL